MRKLLFLVLLATACSYSEEKADILVKVDGIPADADHLNVVVTPSDTSVATKGCTAEMTKSAGNSICYRPTFQPSSLNPPALELAFAQPAASGTFTVTIDAFDRNATQLATGSTAARPLPVTSPPLELQVTLH